MPYFGQEQLIQAEKKGPLTSPEYRAALANNHRSARVLGLDAVMAKHRLDALVAPSMIPPWPIDLVNGDSVPFAAFSVAGPTSIAAVAGYPHITVPAGFVRRLPVGISFIGRAWSEPTLIRIVYAYEQATKHRRPPTMRRRPICPDDPPQAVNAAPSTGTCRVPAHHRGFQPIALCRTARPTKNGPSRSR